MEELESCRYQWATGTPCLHMYWLKSFVIVYIDKKSKKSPWWLEKCTRSLVNVASYHGTIEIDIETPHNKLKYKTIWDVRYYAPFVFDLVIVGNTWGFQNYEVLNSTLYTTQSRT